MTLLRRCYISRSQLTLLAASTVYESRLNSAVTEKSSIVLQSNFLRFIAESAGLQLPRVEHNAHMLTCF